MEEVEQNERGWGTQIAMFGDERILCLQLALQSLRERIREGERAHSHKL